MTNPPTQALRKAAQGIQARKTHARTAKAPKRVKIASVGPTEERLNHNDTQSAGMATRITPPIETMKARNQLTDDEFAILKAYSLAVATAYGSETRSCCDNSVRGGGGDGPSAAVTHARIIASQYENRAGPHVSLVRAVCRDDKTLTQWCIDKFGSKEHRRKGRPVEIVPKGKARVSQALGQLKNAARWMKERRKSGAS